MTSKIEQKEAQDKVEVLKKDVENKAEELKEAIESTESPAVFKGTDGELYTEEEWHSPVLMGGPSRETIEGWKEKHKDIYFLPYESEIYIIRTLLRPEYKEILRNNELNALDREEKFTEKCVLFPYNYTIESAKEGKAGVPSLITDIVMEKSGFQSKSGAIKL